MVKILLFYVLIIGEVQTALVEPREGISIFYLSRPSAPFEVLGTFKVKQQWTGEPKEQIETALKKAHKDFPTANGIIFTDTDMKEAQAILLK